MLTIGNTAIRRSSGGAAASVTIGSAAGATASVAKTGM